MSLEWPARSRAARPSSARSSSVRSSSVQSSFLAWSNPLAWWWGLLTLVSGVNIAVWFLLYREFREQPSGSLGSTSGIELMLLLCAAYVFGCAFRSLPSARGCPADLPVRHLAVERCRRTVGGNHRRDLLRGAVGDYSAPTGHDDGSRHHLERRVGDRAADPDRGMLLMVCGADHQLFGQRHRKFDMGRCVLRGRDRPLPAAAGVSMVRFARSLSSRSSGLPAIWRFS